MIARSWEFDPPPRHQEASKGEGALQITKRIHVSGVSFSRSSNIPVQINFGHSSEHGERLRLSTKDCRELGLIPSQSLVGREVKIRLESRKERNKTFPTRPSKRRRSRKSHRRDLVENRRRIGNFRIAGLEKIETVHIPDARNHKRPAIIRERSVLSLHIGGPYGSISIIRSPDGSLSVDLTKEEYEKCKTLPAGSYFKVRFIVGKKSGQPKGFGKKPKSLSPKELRRLLEK